ncbi:MAG: 3-deoxy-7-phosphoheptulonate synthase [Verrucomicrobiales bacterium]|jgi:3-deoxy-7-phosphoheptulonate synthase|nr:3-deoxy-7-phosphoheptulonate synthase [Verrucomicrobiales bacterium]MDP4849878.1 3-deoxy-7-phosphoheptulonate synthase [Verrucomicrobiales bacterium]MDP4940427.1 3-deoxy-7-phosphoheptulonate synthase [Verrucomicrobiales bacterium]
MPDQVSDLNVVYNVPLPAPALLMHEIRRTDAQAQTVFAARRRLEDILHGRDDRFIVIVGPCSIHDPVQGLEYAAKLASLRDEVKDRIEIVMRVYFEKPRTSVGWKGLIMDPDLDGTANLSEGLRIARQLLCEIADLGLPAATEFLDPITPQYIADLISWAAIGARTVESQTHRQMASGLSMPVGFKNTTFGGMSAVVNALKAAMAPQTFFGISPEGVASMVSTRGNKNCHTVLRGGDDGPNYSAASVAIATGALAKGGVSPAVVIDASHANCSKDYEKMPAVFEDIVAQRVAGNRHVVGAMLESNLVEGNQPILDDHTAMTRGQSVTDPCINWEVTERIIRAAAEKLG